MHDPMVVAFEIRRPWPTRTSLPAAPNGVRWRIRHHHEHNSHCVEDGCSGNPFPWWRLNSYSAFWRLAGRDYYWTPIITVWHVEPGGRDALTVCRHRYQDENGQWRSTGSWRWHVHHWHLQFPPLQELRRRLLTRCEWCGGRSTKRDPVNVSNQWDGPKGRWWQGDPNLFHSDCSTVEHVHRMCFCDDPLLGNGDYGICAFCGKFRAWHQEIDEADRLIRSIPEGQRIPNQMRPRLEVLRAERRARNEQEAS